MKSFFIFLFFIVFVKSNYAQVSASAGSPKFLCYGASATMGGAPTATGGTPPYTYLWTPSTFLNSTTVPNPTAIGCTDYVLYSLLVIDSNNDTAVSYTEIKIDEIYKFNAGIDTGYCYGQQAGVQIGSSINTTAAHAFNWLPSAGLDNNTAANPFGSPTVTTTYTLTVSDGKCPNNVSYVTVTPFIPPIADAGLDLTINEGETVTLHGTGGTLYWWQPDYNIKYGNTANPDVWPIISTTYTLYIEDQHKCSDSDTIRVNVINGTFLFFYNTFTPNNDGENDKFYIGNVEKFPDNVLKIYNRYGKMIYSATNYANDWDGKYLGNEVPTGTYFYTFDDGVDKKYKGTVTIMR